MVSHVNVDVTFLWARSHLCHFCHGVLTCAICTCTILGLHDLMTVSSKTISLFFFISLSLLISLSSSAVCVCVYAHACFCKCIYMYVCMFFINIVRACVPVLCVCVCVCVCVFTQSCVCMSHYAMYECLLMIFWGSLFIEGTNSLKIVV